MKLKIINIFIIFCFIIPFTASMYININAAFANTGSQNNNIEDNTSSGNHDDITDTPSDNTDKPDINIPPKSDDLNIYIDDTDNNAANNTYGEINPDSLIDTTVTVKVYNRTVGSVVEMTLHDYIICAVAGEMPATFELEALKAQAVAARTFTVSHLRSSCSSNSSAHVCTYYGCCQAFVSVEQMKKNWGSQFEDKYAKIKAAVEETDSLVMLYNNSPITVFYFSTSNGYTDACQDVFVKNLPYYKSVASPGEETAPNYYSYVKISYDEFAQTLSSELGINISADEIESSVAITRTDGGRVKSISFNGQSVKGTAIRTAFGLKSADFHLTFFDDHILIEVYGYGHGVGMSQLGANYMAQNSSSFLDILNHYYIGVDITEYK